MIKSIESTHGSVPFKHCWPIDIIIFENKKRNIINDCMTSDLYLGQVKGQRKNLYQKIFSRDRQASWYEWISSCDYTIRTFICPFFITFSVIIQWQHDIFCHTSWYELGPWPMCPPSFIEISWTMSEIWPQSNYTTIIIVYTKPYNFKIPFPL